MCDESILVVADGNEPMEVELCDGIVPVSTLTHYFGLNAIGLRWKNPKTGYYRVLRAKNGVILPPNGEWEEGQLYQLFTSRSFETSNQGSFNRSPTATIKSEVLTEDDFKVSVKQEPHTNVSCRVKVEQGQEGTVLDLTRKELEARASTSVIARTVLFQWNKLNTTIRRLVHSTKFHGTAGMTKCAGTTEEQAIQNRALRDGIVERPEVTSLFTTFLLEDGSGRVVFDSIKAANHVRHVINDMKRHTKSRPTIILSDVTNDSVAEEENSDHKESAFGKIVKGKLSKKTRKAPSNCKKMQSSPSSDAGNCSSDEAFSDNSEDKDKTEERTSAKRKKAAVKIPSNKKRRMEELDENLDERSEYELERATKVKMNNDLIAGLGLGKSKLDSGDAVLVARKFLSQSYGPKPTLKDIRNEIELCGLIPLAPKANVRDALVYLGNELVSANLVTLNKAAGLRISDITIV